MADDAAPGLDRRDPALDHAAAAPARPGEGPGGSVLPAPGDLLENTRRRLLYDYVLRNPGTHFREAVRRAGIPAGSARHHLNRLALAGLLAIRRQGANLRLFENHVRYSSGWERLAASRDENSRLLLDWLQRNPDSPQKAVLDTFQALRGWNRSTTQKRLARLESLGVLSSRPHGRYRVYRVAAGVG